MVAANIMQSKKLAKKAVPRPPSPGQAETAAKHQLRPIAPVAKKSRKVFDRLHLVRFHPLDHGLIPKKLSPQTRIPAISRPITSEGERRLDFQSALVTLVISHAGD